MRGINISRIGSAIVLLLILIFGFLKFWVLRIFADVIINIRDLFDLPIEGIISHLQNQAVSSELRYQSIGWIIYYPLYLFLHVAFIYFLFINNKKTRNIVVIGLLSFVFGTIGLWAFLTAIGFPVIGDFFRLQFRNLFSLPFILLMIEGGRILYLDLKKRYES